MQVLDYFYVSYGIFFSCYTSPMCLWAHCVQVRFPFKAICTYSTISACIYRESLRLYRFPSALFPISSCFLVIGMLFHKGWYSVVTVCFFSACSVANLPFYWIVLVRAFAKVTEPLWTGIGALTTHHCCVSAEFLMVRPSIILFYQVLRSRVFTNLLASSVSILTFFFPARCSMTS